MAAAPAAARRAYEDFVPPHNVVTEPATHTLSVDLSAAGYNYKKEHVRVQLVRSHGLLVVRGECPVAGNRWSRFRLEFRVPDGCDLKGIHARFDGGVVRVTMPGVKTGPTVISGTGGKADAAGAQDGGVSAREKTGDHAQGKEGDEIVRKQQEEEEEERAGAAAKDSGHLDKGAGAGVGVGGDSDAAAAPPRSGYAFLPERRKLVTTVVCALLVLFSLGIFVRYSLAP